MRRTEVAEENFNVYAINSTAIVYIADEFCVALPGATAGLLNNSSSFGYNRGSLTGAHEPPGGA